MEFLLAVGATIVARVTECTFYAARRLVGCTLNVAYLRTKLLELRNAKDVLQGRIDQAKHDGELIAEDVQSWMTEAARICQEAESFICYDCQRADIKCLGGSLPNIVSRRRLRKRAKAMADSLGNAVEGATGDRFQTIATRPALQSCIANMSGYESFGTREHILEKVMVALSCNEVRMVGLYGMGGVGKTVLAKEVARRATEKHLFSEVVFITVSQELDIIAIQQSIAEKIHLDLSKFTTVEERSDRLKRRLNEEKKVFIILDDIWNTLDLGEVGLNFDPEQIGCKILMTSRSVDITRNSMGAEKNILVDELSPVEAINLFTTVVGTNVVERPQFKILAIDVVRECKGLPLAVKTVASALKGKEIAVWEDALLQLQNSAPTNIDGMLTRVYPSIRLSFDYLESHEAQKVLFLCSLFGEDRNIAVEELIALCLGWGLFPDVHSISAAKRRVRSLIIKLKERCLLLDVHRDGLDLSRGRGDLLSDQSEVNWVKMHDVIRDVAIFVASGDDWNMHSFMINDNLEYCLSKKRLKDSKAMTLIRNRRNDYRLPVLRSFEYPQLELFLMTDSVFWRTSAPHTLFNDLMKGCVDLKVLSLYKADLVSFPSSFHLLQNLATLCLADCKLNLEDIDYIGDLKNLMVLDLRWSNVRELPVKIGQLNRLQVLNLSECYDLKVIRAKVISRLTELEELYIPHSFGNWDAEGGNAGLAELGNLQKLVILSLRIPDAKTIPDAPVFSSKLERFKIMIGSREDMFRINTPRALRTLSITNSAEHLTKDHGIECLMRSSESLTLEGSIRGVENNIGYYPDLKTLKEDGCGEIKYVVASGQPCSPIFLKLEDLWLQRLSNLEVICHGKLTSDSFGQLKKVNVADCGRLKNLFPLSIATRLYDIGVSFCRTMEEIIALNEETDSVSQGPFPIELRSLCLSSLPKFIQFAHRPQSVIGFSEYPLFDEKVELPELKILKLLGMDAKKLWADELPSTSKSMKKLSELTVNRSDNLKYLSSTSTVADSLVSLIVEASKSLEVLFTISNKQDGDEEGKHLFPQLTSIKLINLPNLKHFCSAVVNHEIAQCGEPETFFNKLGYPALQHLTLKQLNIERLFPDFDHRLLPTTSCFENLRELIIRKCYNLKYLLSLTVAKGLEKLELLEVIDCGEMEGILVRKTLAEELQPSVSDPILFPKLKCLALSGLPTLEGFCFGDDGCTRFPNSTKHLKLSNCPKLQFDNKLEGFPALETCTLSVLNIESLVPECDHRLPPTTYCMDNLRALEVGGCHNLKYLFSLSVAKRLVKLETLRVGQCSHMESIVVTKMLAEEHQPSAPEPVLFPKLKSLHFFMLPALERICLGFDGCPRLPNLISVHVSCCPKLPYETRVELLAADPRNVLLASVSMVHRSMYLRITENDQHYEEGSSRANQMSESL